MSGATSPIFGVAFGCARRRIAIGRHRAAGPLACGDGIWTATARVVYIGRLGWQEQRGGRDDREIQNGCDLQGAPTRMAIGSARFLTEAIGVGP